MKGQHLHYNIGHFEGLYVTKATGVSLYSHQGQYFLGENTQHGQVHLDLTTQSVLVAKGAVPALVRRASRHLQRFT